MIHSFIPSWTKDALSTWPMLGTLHVKVTVVFTDPDHARMSACPLVVTVGGLVNLPQTAGGGVLLGEGQGPIWRL